MQSLKDIIYDIRKDSDLCDAVETDGILCFNKKHAKGLCLKHYNRFRKYNSLNLPVKEIKKCKFIDCNDKHHAKEYCLKHYQSIWAIDKRNRSGLKKCKIDNCNDNEYVKGFCNKHYLKLERYGDPNYKQTRNNGRNHPNVLGKRKYKKCIVLGCCHTSEIPNSIIKGLCTKHYQRWQKFKDYNIKTQKEYLTVMKQKD
jgi:hypothetical protein